MSALQSHATAQEMIPIHKQSGPTGATLDRFPFTLRLGGKDLISPEDGQKSRFVIHFKEADAFERVPYPTAADIGAAYSAGAIDVEGDIEAAYGYLRASLGHSASETATEADSNHGPATFDLAAIRDQVNSHYDLPVEFWRPWLGDSLLYTCAYYESESDDLTRAQARKIDRICRKLRLSPGDRFLDVGCGWGALTVHAAKVYGVEAVGITLSDLQAARARAAAQAAGVGERCRIMVCDYRQLPPGHYDKIAAVGICEHLGNQLADFLTTMHERLVENGLFLNQAIVHAPQARFVGQVEFIKRHIFPGASLRPLHEVLAEGELAGLEVMDVESLSPHYVLTLREWLRRFEAAGPGLVAIAGERRCREFRAYLAGFACEFALSFLRVYQTVFRKPSCSERPLGPLTRI